MIYSRVAAYPFSSLHLPHGRIVAATRRLHAHSKKLKEKTSERDLPWLGMLVCLASGVLEMGVLHWLLN